MMLELPGGPAFSAFRLEKLLARARERVPGIQAVEARYWHFVDLEQALDARHREVLDALLSYGPPPGP